jgi:predicted ArsR family transcriptional regulator
MTGTRWEILQFLKRGGPARADDIAAHVGITPSGVRQHLTALERDGLLAFHERRDGPGRPKHVYALTEDADAIFPRRYDDLANELLAYVADEDPALVERLFDRRARRRLEQARTRVGGLSLGDKVREVARILDEDGYLAEFAPQADGSYLITEHNCAVLGVARRYGWACTSELAFLQDVLAEADVTRVAHMIAGAHVCAYAVRPRG